MNPEVTQYIYFNYQPNQYYRKYLKQHKHRADSRKSDQHRNIKVNINGNKNTVTLSRGNTIIIAQLTTNIQQVVYSPISNSYGKQLINIVVTPFYSVSAKNTKNERDTCKSIENAISSFINWKIIQKQLVYHSSSQSAIFAHVGQILIRIADHDGCLQETALLALQLVLWIAKFDIIETIVQNPTQNSKTNRQSTQQQNPNKFILKLTQFWYPIKYCEILDVILVDPSKKQQQSSNYQITIVGTLKSSRNSVKPYHILHVHKSGSLPQQTINSIEKLYKIQISKIPFNIQQLQKKSLSGIDQVNLVINQ